MTVQPPFLIRQLGLTDFEATWHAMQKFTAERTANTPDELWLTEHSVVYTLGLNRKNVRLPVRNNIPLVPTDRGGKITYHGPGQLIIYVLFDLKRGNLNIRKLVSLLENSVIELLNNFGKQAVSKADAPGVYVEEAKIAALGLRIKNNCCYHGLSLNINMDLSPFDAIDPCGYVGLKVTQTKALGINANVETISELLLNILMTNLGSQNNLVNGNTND
ncbi:lipoyl(octanoyl) transferase LipB [Methylotenera sp.]|uniref:lipoyl(octanoyl) transferase LipB n=1 Tax=Methylotenera sp. TaxID=2051956 RepID=UPI0024881B52|nr:lipoyl(octanoyl) transferase LipB [Methylotenera sp.]MDI1298844.1 lipoyl(octanoyl) transferase LipB [Methylotenera sp.]